MLRVIVKMFRDMVESVTLLKEEAYSKTEKGTQLNKYIFKFIIPYIVKQN